MKEYFFNQSDIVYYYEIMDIYSHIKQYNTGLGFWIGDCFVLQAGKFEVEYYSFSKCFNNQMNL